MNNKIVFESLKNGHFMTLSAYGMPRYLEKISQYKFVIKGKSFRAKEELFKDFDSTTENVDFPKKGFRSIEFDGGPFVEVGSILILPDLHLVVEEIRTVLPGDILNKEIELGQILKYKLTVKTEVVKQK